MLCIDSWCVNLEELMVKISELVASGALPDASLKLMPSASLEDISTSDEQISVENQSTAARVHMDVSEALSVESVSNSNKLKSARDPSYAVSRVPMEEGGYYYYYYYSYVFYIY